MKTVKKTTTTTKTKTNIVDDVDEEDMDGGFLGDINTNYFLTSANTFMNQYGQVVVDTFSDASDIDDNLFKWYQEDLDNRVTSQRIARQVEKYRHDRLTHELRQTRTARGFKTPLSAYHVNPLDASQIFYYRPLPSLPSPPPPPSPSSPSLLSQKRIEEAREEEESSDIESYGFVETNPIFLDHMQRNDPVAHEKRERYKAKLARIAERKKVEAQKKALIEKKMQEEEEARKKLDEQASRLANPFKDINYLSSSAPDLIRFLKSTIMHQEGTAYLVDAILSARSGGGPDIDDKNIITCVISGTSGCGKTEAATQIKKLFNLEHDTNHFISYNFGSFKNKDIHSQMVGVAHGFEGSGKPCLVDKLNDALEYNRKKQEVKKNVKITKREEIDALYPKIIYIFIDELDKAERDIMDSLNSLLDRGYMKSATGVEFNLPFQTTLFIVFTANFGDKVMLQNPNLNYFEGVEVIRRSLSQHGYKDCDIGRLSNIIPFRPLSRENARAILKDKLPAFIKKYSQKCKKYSSMIHMSENDQNAFVEKCLDKGYTMERGIRQAVYIMKQELKTKQDFQLDHLRKHIDTKKVSLPLYPPPELKFNTIEFTESLNTQFLREKNHDMSLALQDSYNEMGVERCIQSKTSIDYLSLSHASMNKPFYGILAPHALTININNYNSDPRLLDKFEKNVEEIASLKQENEQLKNFLKRKRDDLTDISQDPSYKKLSRKVKQKVNNSIKKDKWPSLVTTPSSSPPLIGNVRSLTYCNKMIRTTEDEEDELNDEMESGHSSSSTDESRGRDKFRCPVCMEWKHKSLFEHTVQNKGKSYSYLYLEHCATCRKKKKTVIKRMVMDNDDIIIENHSENSK